MESSISLHALASSVGIGLLIGAVRERAKAEPGRPIAGVRTHLLVAVAGTLAAALGTAVLVAVLVLLGVIMAVDSARRSTEAGLTGQVAVPVTALLAAMALSYPGFATGVAVVMAAALYAKEPLHVLVRERLSDTEIRAGLLLAGAALVVLPLLPDEPVDPWGVLVPSKLWHLVVLILAVGMAGHVALRVVGARWGLPLAGFFSGFASSTAAVAGYGQRARAEVGHVGHAASGALFANLGSLCLLAGVIGAGAPALLHHVAWPLFAGGLVLMPFALAGVARRDGLDRLPASDDARVFHLTHALLLAGLMALVLVVSALIHKHFGSVGALLASAAVAAVDQRAAAASLTQLAVQQGLSLPTAGWGVVLLVLVANLVKSVLAFVSGGRGYGWHVAAALLAMPAAMALVLWLGQGGR
ncbi:MAG: DUF4010 domain-containing protein [Pseudomonadota bacterium]|jgi:uncharacterized membrane protein (DUF4010 family)|nr:MAG: hypothetical protein DIU62_00135 [Pseudomonadota bacterium]